MRCAVLSRAHSRLFCHTFFLLIAWDGSLFARDVRSFTLLFCQPLLNNNGPESDSSAQSNGTVQKHRNDIYLITKYGFVCNIVPPAFESLALLIDIWTGLSAMHIKQINHKSITQCNRIQYTYTLNPWPLLNSAYFLYGIYETMFHRERWSISHCEYAAAALMNSKRKYSNY